MNKRQFLILLFTLLFLLTLSDQPVLGHMQGAYYNSLDPIGISNPDWMADVSGELKLSELSIPGTHDSLASLFPFPPADLWIRTQSMTLRQQLDAGIRAFDMRPKNFGDRFEMYHGPAPLFGKVDKTHGIFEVLEFGEDVLDPIREFLDMHGDEVVIMSVGSSGPEGADFNDIFKDYMADYEAAGGELWSPYTPDPNDPNVFIGPENNPKLKNLRGKLVIIQHFTGTDKNGKDWGLKSDAFEDANRWEIESTGELYLKWDNGLPATSQPTDIDERDIKHHLENADNSTTDKIYFTGLSANTAEPNCPTLVEPLTLDKISAWVVCVATYLASQATSDVLVHPAFAASGHAAPFFNDSPRLWTFKATDPCTGCFFPLPIPINCNNCYPDWHRRSCDYLATAPFPQFFRIEHQKCVDYEGTNVLAMNYINGPNITNKVGIIGMDYPGPGLINAIIGLNKPDSNVAPVVNSPTLVPDPAEEGSQVHAEATFFDLNAGDSHTCMVNYGDNSGPQNGSVSGNTCSGPPHMYADDGNYLVAIEVTEVGPGGLSGTNASFLPVSNVLPTVEAGINQTVNEGDPVSLGPATFTDPGILDTHTATIDWGDGTDEAGVVADTMGANGTVSGSHIYPDNDGSPFTVTVCVKDNFDYGEDHPELGWVCDVLTVNVSNVPPTVNTPTVSPEPSDEGSPVAAWATFSDPGGGYDLPYTCEINYGDGGTDSLVINQYGDFCDFASSPHVYADNGEYPVTVFVTDKDGGIGQKSTTHTVDNIAPMVEAGPDQEVNEGDVVSLAPATFHDPGILDTHTATIDWGDTTSSNGDVTKPPGEADGTVDGSHVYADNGVYPVQVCVTDNDGGEDCDSLTVTVNNVAPTVEAGSDQEIKEGDELFLEPATFNDKGTLDTHTATINWGDLSPEDVGVVTESPSGPPGNSNGADGSVAGSHVYVEDGLYVVTVCVEDDDGAETCDMFNAVVENAPPVVEAGPDQTINEAETVVLAPATFTDPGILDTHTAVIDWGEGTDEDVGVTEPSDGAPGTVDGSHTYGDNGTYIITVCVSDDDGGMGCDFLTATVNNLNPTTALDTSTAIPMDGGDVFLGRRGEEQNFSADGSDPGSDDLTFNWSFPPSANGASNIYYNDGENPDPFPSPDGTFPFDASDGNSSTFDAPGVYTVELNVEDDDGGTAADNLTLLITDNRDCTGVQAFWGQQFSGHGQTVIDPDRLQAYLDIVRFASAYFNDSNLGSLDDANAILVPGGGSDPDNRAIQEGLAAWLNFAAGGVLWNETIPHLDQTFAETIVDIEATLLNPDASKQDFNAAMQDGIKINTSKPSQAHCKEPAKKQ